MLNKEGTKALVYLSNVDELNLKTNREGIIVRALDGSFSFKVISDN